LKEIWGADVTLFCLTGLEEENKSQQTAVEDVGMDRGGETRACLHPFLHENIQKIYLYWTWTW